MTAKQSKRARKIANRKAASLSRRIARERELAARSEQS